MLTLKTLKERGFNPKKYREAFEDFNHRPNDMTAVARFHKVHPKNWMKEEEKQDTQLVGRMQEEAMERRRYELQFIVFPLDDGRAVTYTQTTDPMTPEKLEETKTLLRRASDVTVEYDDPAQGTLGGTVLLNEYMFTRTLIQIVPVIE